jgi:cytokinin riboside 5'-monophosphate phosphoribohydrolase
MAAITVYCSSSDHIDATYRLVARELGHALADRGHELVYGGGRVGLMGEVASGVHERGGSVYGVIPEALKAREGIAYELSDSLVVTQTMQERKAIMYQRADAFIVLPGGFGTLEELLEVLTLRQLGYHDKPIALVNTVGFYQPLLDVFEHFYRERFAGESSRRLYSVVTTPEEAIQAVEESLSTL